MTRAGSRADKTHPPEMLARLLATARAELHRLRTYAGEFAARGEGTFSPRQVASFCAFLDQAGVNLQGRIAYLGPAAASSAGDLFSPRSRPGKSPRTRSLIVIYRSCSRRLCRALAAAKQAGDDVTVWLLGDVMHRLERQLWLLDPESGAGQAAALFYRA